MSWWPPWRRKEDEEIRDDVRAADRRLDESKELLRRAQRSERNMNGHIRHNRFGELIQQQVFGGK